MKSLAVVLLACIACGTHHLDPGATDVIRVLASPRVSLRPTVVRVIVVIERPVKFWCPEIELKAGDGLQAWPYRHVEQSDCGPDDQGRDRATWVHDIPLGPGRWTILATVDQGGVRSKAFAIVAIGEW